MPHSTVHKYCNRRSICGLSTIEVTMRGDSFTYLPKLVTCPGCMENPEKEYPRVAQVNHADESSMGCERPQGDVLEKS